MDGLQIKFRFLERLKSSFISMRINKIISFSKKMNMGLKSTGSQLLLPFRKIPFCQLALQGGGMKKCLSRGKLKDSSKVSTLGSEPTWLHWLIN